MSLHKKLIKEWKKVLESDYQYVVNEIKGEVEGPSVIFLEGKVGMGKTTFARFFSGDAVLSPTYSIICELDDMIHADFYRLESASELLELEIPLYLERKEYFLAEWGVKYFRDLINYIPEHFHYYVLEFEGPEGSEDRRNLQFHQIDPMLS